MKFVFQMEEISIYATFQHDCVILKNAVIYLIFMLSSENTYAAAEPHTDSSRDEKCAAECLLEMITDELEN